MTARQIAPGPAAASSGGTRPTALYQLYAADETLLYVGITMYPGERFTTHARDKAWWPSVARKTVDWHGCRADAMAAETLAIAAGNPVHNSVRPRQVRAEFAPAPDADGELMKVARTLSAFGCAPPIVQIRDAPALFDQVRTALTAYRATALSAAESGGMKRAEIARQLGISRQQITKIAEGPKSAKEGQK